MIEQRLFQLINLPNTYIGEAPIGIDNCQWIKATSGSSTTYFSKDNYDRPTFSIYIRDKNNEQACIRTKQIFNQIRNHTDAKSAILITRLPSIVGKDDKHRTVYTFQLEYQTGGY